MENRRWNSQRFTYNGQSLPRACCHFLPYPPKVYGKNKINKYILTIFSIAFHKTGLDKKVTDKFLRVSRYAN
jgi:hypothetical protein